MGDGGTCIDCTSTTSSYFLCKLQGRDGNPERHPFCFEDTGSLQILYSLSEPNWCVLFGICATNYRREDMGCLLIPPLGTQIFICKLDYLLAALWCTTRIRPSALLVGIRWRKYKVTFIWGCKCLRFVNLFGFYPRYKQDLRVVGRLFVATAGVD